jgi:hypothetical protein
LAKTQPFTEISGPLNLINSRTDLSNSSSFRIE